MAEENKTAASAITDQLDQGKELSSSDMARAKFDAEADPELKKEWDTALVEQKENEDLLGATPGTSALDDMPEGMNPQDAIDQLLAGAGIETARVEESVEDTPEEVVSESVTSPVVEGRDIEIPAIGDHKELSVSALMQILGLPNASQMLSVNSELELLRAKLETVQVKMDRLVSEMAMSSQESSIKKIEMHVTEMRKAMKMFFPTAFTVADNVADTSTSSVQEQEETSVHVDVPSAEDQEEEEEEPLTDEEYQALEAKKLRYEEEKKIKEQIAAREAAAKASS